MFRIAWYAMIMLMCVCGFAHAQDSTKFDARDFYLYDEANLITRLRIAPKIILYFSTATLSDEERDAFLKTLSLSDRKTDRTNSSRQILEFSSFASEEYILDMLTAINHSGIAHGMPVVLVDNIEAVAEGFIVEPRTPLAPETLVQHLKTIGEFSIRQTKQQANAWLFVVDEVKPPLHIYSLINLIHEDAWIKSVRPQFTYLHDPIVAMLTVTPISGTVDETRIATLSVHVFDDTIKIRDDLLPQFGEGKFIPTPATYSPLFFFPLVGEKEPPRMRKDARGYVISFSWRFRMFAVGEWTISDQIIAYERKGKQFTVSVPQGMFVVTSLVGSLSLGDIPSPKILPVLGKPDASLPQKPPQLPVYWFDRWVYEPRHVATYSFFATLAFVMIGAGVLIFWGVAAWQKNAREKSKTRALINRWRNVCGQASERVCAESYRVLEEALISLLTHAFPDMLPRSPGIKDIEAVARNAFNDNQWSVLCALYEELESMHAKDFAPEALVLREIAANFMRVIDHLIPRITHERKSL